MLWPPVWPMKYSDYLLTNHWKNLKLSAFKKHKRICGVCGFKHQLQVHHHTYRFPWDSCTVDDLSIRCDLCHAAEHGIQNEELKLTIFQRDVLYFFRTGVHINESDLMLEHIEGVAELVELGLYKRSVSDVDAEWRP